MSEPVEWPEREGATPTAPRSPRFDDTYFSAEDGLAETRAVFLAGCGLPRAWAGRDHFTIGELGFGTGLNILATLALWRDTRPSSDARLHLFSVEAYPMARADAERALARWPELADLTAPLLAAWPQGRRGWRRIVWPQIGATLDLAVAEVGEALAGWTGKADAWFLDGFAPSRNPEMWRGEVLAAVVEHARPGARIASFTVAGQVRRDLEACGVTVARVPGFGRKKQRLEAHVLGAPPADPPTPRVAILGAGIAGASLNRAFADLGVAARVFDPDGPGAGASGNAAALVTPRLDAGFGANARLHAQAFARAVDLYGGDTPGAVIAAGALQLEAGPRDRDRFDRIAAWDGFEDGELARLGAHSVAERLGEACASSGLAFGRALVVEPAVILSRWLGDVVDRRAACALEPASLGWRLLKGGALVCEADIVVVASGAASAELTGLALRRVRGQVSLADTPFSGAPAAWGGYATPTRTGILFGATHDRDDDATDVRAQDHIRNLAQLSQGRPALAANLKDAPLTGRAGVRAATPDHLPLAGPVPGMAGVFVLSGLGGRGFTLAPLLAETIAAHALGLGGPLPKPLIEIVDPGRFSKA